ncbi:MAG: tetratricopeptide repeat protein [bacterium]|nr:tetratricopeptide repeat protein [bacterium]
MTALENNLPSRSGPARSPTRPTELPPGQVAARRGGVPRVAAATLQPRAFDATGSGGLQGSIATDHPNVAIRLNNLAALLQATNRLEEAEPLMLRALLILEESLGADHLWTQGARRNLTSLSATTSEF